MQEATARPGFENPATQPVATRSLPGSVAAAVTTPTMVRRSKGTDTGWRLGVEPQHPSILGFSWLNPRGIKDPKFEDAIRCPDRSTD